MNIRQLDLNLLLVFDAIYQERSISAAAEKLDLSQPAVSNALRRLRKFTGDTLFFRAEGAMMPTRTATSLAVPIRHALSTVEQSLSSLELFDPATSSRAFKIAAADFFRWTLVPSLMNVLEQEAPNLQLEVLPLDAGGEPTTEALRRKDIDIALLIPHIVQNDPDLTHILSDTDRVALIVRTGHPILESNDILGRMNEARYIATSQAPLMRALIDKALAQYGVTRKTACLLPDTTSIPAIVEMTDLIGVVGKNYLNRCARDHSVTELQTGIPMPATGAAIAWSSAFNDDPGHRWMREKVQAILKAAAHV